MLATSTADALEGNNWYKLCENLVHVASTIGELQHTECGISQYF